MQTIMNTSEELFHWRVLAASVRGKSHEKVGQLCQDAHHWEKLPEGVLVAAVADGAGSATLGKVGAIVAAQTAVETIRLKDPTPRSPDDEEGWQLLLTKALAAAKTAVEAEAVACRMTARDLATTLIIVIATPKLIAAAQIGDGVAVAGDGEGKLVALTTPQRGEYINETTFLVSPNALDTAQMNLWRGKAANIALLSDGLQLLALELNQGTPHVPFFSPLFNFMANVTNETEAKEQLVAFLRSPRIADRTDDDLTLLLATLMS
jgi:serine/threonine protein phosphatase PrpC